MFRVAILPKFYAFCSFLLMSGFCHSTAAASEDIAILVPDGTFKITFSGTGFERKLENEFPEKQGCYFLYSNSSSEISISFFIEPRHGSNEAAAYRDETWEKLRYVYSNAINVNKSLLNGGALIEYLLPELGSIKMEQQNMNLHFVKGSYWIDVHVSKMNYNPDDRKLFIDLLSSIQFKDSGQPDNKISQADSTKSATAFYVLQGSSFLEKQDLPRAIKYFSLAFEIDKVHPTLDSVLRYILIDDLSMAYGMNNQLDEAKAILDYGIAKDASYPIFYYMMACVYGEKRDMEKCMDYLRLAYKYKANILKGERFPDPETDSSFQYFMNNNRFKEFLKEMGK